MELYGERGYELTTAAEIAAKAGVTERTFFRHFADKREVLFDGEILLIDILNSAVREAPSEPNAEDAGLRRQFAAQIASTEAQGYAAAARADAKVILNPQAIE